MKSQSAASIEISDTNKPARLYYLDWLRVLAILSVFFLHTAKIFDYHTYDLYNAVRSPVLSAIREFILIWVMPLFFVISGAAVFLSLKPGKVWRFFKSRITRLVIPLVVVGTFLVNPLYVYAVRLFDGQATMNFFQWYPQFFHGMFGFGGNFAPLGWGTYMWYLQSLFIYSLLLLPLFVWSKKRIAGGLKTFSRHFENPILLFLLFIPISLSNAGFEFLEIRFLKVMGSWDPISYLFFFGYGYMIYSNQRIQGIIKRYGPIFLAVGVVLTLVHIDSHFGFNLIIPGITRHDMSAGGALRPLNINGWAFVEGFRAIISWCLIIGFLGTGSRLLNFDNKYRAYANEAVLPFYILHHAVIHLTGAYIVLWNTGIATKFVAIAAISFAIIMIIYELLVRRINILRFLFGMKMK
jgi:glucan biosynthesis protein C